MDELLQQYLTGLEERDPLVVHDVAAMLYLPPRKCTGWLRRASCFLGFHIWGFVHCPACGAQDALLALVVIRQWEELSSKQRSVVLAHAENAIQEIFRTVH